MKIHGFILDELTTCRDELYNSLPSGDLDAFELIKVIKVHIKNLDKVIDYYSKLKQTEITIRRQKCDKPEDCPHYNELLKMEKEEEFLGSEVKRLDNLREKLGQENERLKAELKTYQSYRVQQSKGDYWLCQCGSYHKRFPYVCPLRELKEENKALRDKVRLCHDVAIKNCNCAICVKGDLK